MKFSEAKDRLKELAKGGYHSLVFDFTAYDSGALATECYLYIENKHASGKTWEEAFVALEREMGISVVVEELPDIEEAPDTEPVQAVGE